MRLRTILTVVMVIGALAALDRFLARTEQEEVQGAALSSWQKGTRLMREGHAAEALDALRNAHTLVLDNVVYERDMIPALMALGRTAEADPLMEDVLQREPNDGESNLTAARLMAKEERVRRIRRSTTIAPFTVCGPRPWFIVSTPALSWFSIWAGPALFGSGTAGGTDFA